MKLKIGVPKEVAAKERRVALTPDVCSALIRTGVEISVETGAGSEAFFADEDYRRSGATIVSTAAAFGDSDIVVKVSKPQESATLGTHEVAALREGAVFISFLNVVCDPELIDRFVNRRITSFSMEKIPRISRAQSMDALTSQASISGYKAAILAAASLPRYFPMMMTASGTKPPASMCFLASRPKAVPALT